MPQRRYVPPRPQVADLDVGVAGRRGHVHVVLGARRYLDLIHWLGVVFERVDAILRSKIPKLHLGVHGATRHQVIARERAILRGDAGALREVLLEGGDDAAVLDVPDDDGAGAAADVEVALVF